MAPEEVAEDSAERRGSAAAAEQAETQETQDAAAETPPEEPLTPAPKPKAKGRPKGSKTVNRKPKPVPAPSEAPSAPAPRVETTPDIFEVIRQRQVAQFERRHAFYQSFLPIR